MRLRTLHRRNLTFHLRMNLAVGLGVFTATAALTGSLLVGDSMRASLRRLAVSRLAGVDHVLRSSRFFDASLVGRLTDGFRNADQPRAAAGIILLQASCVHAESGARVGEINLMGVDAAFDKMDTADGDDDASGFAGDFGLILNEPLARELGARIGDDVLIRVGKPATVSTETLLGRRDDTVVSIRRTVRRIIPATGLGALDLTPRHQTPLNAFLPLDAFQRLLRRHDRVNTILVAGGGGAVASAEVVPMQAVLQEQWRLDDVGLRVRSDDRRGYIAVESDRFLLEPAVERATREAARQLESSGVPTTVGSVLTYLANEIAIEGRGEHAVIPYSTIAALDEPALRATAMTLVGGGSPQALRAGDILLNTWAADDLHVKPGDRVVLEYYVTGRFGATETRRASFALRGVVRLTGGADDPGFTPEYPGVTDTKSIADWDPPFPVDLSKVRDKDERYWDDHRTAPKAFISLDDGLRLWGADADRFGRLTSMRLYARDGATPGPSGEKNDHAARRHPQGMALQAAAFDRALRDHLDVSELGLRLEPVRARALAAGRGSTDFGGLFIGFSFFLILAAAMLVALMFRLGVERRSTEVGMLLAVGFAPKQVTRILVVDGAWVAGFAAAMGLVGSAGYAWLMLAGLRSWWSDAVNAPFLTVSLSPLSLGVGYVASFLVAMISIRWSVRGLTRLSPRSLLAGAVRPPRTSARTEVRGSARKGPGARFTAGVVLSVGSVVLTIVFSVMPFVSDAIPDTAAFFGGGACMLIAMLSGLNLLLRRERRTPIRRGGPSAFILLGLRNASRHAGRGMLTIGLIASAVFVVASMEAFRVDVDPMSNDKDSGTGGFTLVARSTVPLQYDLNTPAGREALNVTEMPPDTRVWALRLRDGDPSSCLNLYLPTNPRLIGATPPMIERGGFAFSATLAESDAERENPWRILNRAFTDGAVPAIGDEAAVLWQHHSGLGKDLVIRDERNREVRLRFVALLKGSALQDELIVDESRFTEMFPSINGYGFFLIEAPPPRATRAASTLERQLSDYGFDATSTAERLTDYLAVQNTYLSTFQALGGLGLVLGTIGLGAVLLRNVWERRGELALMRAVGFSTGALRWIVLTENTLLVTAGLCAGVVPALIAVAPHLARAPGAFPWLSVGGTLLAVLATGTLSGTVALIVALRSPLLPALRSE